MNEALGLAVPNCARDVLIIRYIESKAVAHSEDTEASLCPSRNYPAKLVVSMANNLPNAKCLNITKCLIERLLQKKADFENRSTK